MNKGFTIIETLVAITILLIAITGPLSIAEKGLTEAISSQDQLTASYLAQDLMEYVKNVRDDNLLANSSSWLVSPEGINLGGCTVGSSPCDFDTEAGSPSSPSFVSCKIVTGNLCQIYLTSNGNGYYTPDTGVSNIISTKFSRAFTLAFPGGSASTATSTVVTVTVSWKDGAIANQVVLQDILFNTLR